MLLTSFFKVKVLGTTVVMKYSYGQKPYSYYSYVHIMYVVNQSKRILQGWIVGDTTKFLLRLMGLNAPVPSKIDKDSEIISSCDHLTAAYQVQGNVPGH